MNWAAKYRPKTLDDIVGQPEAVRLLKEALKKPDDVPHLLFEGPPGTGKTSAAFAFFHDLLGESWRSQVQDLNASDDRGIDVIREKVKNFVRTMPLTGTINFVFLDEADALTADAQRALKRLFDDYEEHCRFVLCANEAHKLIEPLRGRCAVYHFGPVPDNVATAMIDSVLLGEGLQERGGHWYGGAIWAKSEGSLRNALNICQQLKAPITPEQLAAIDSSKTYADIVAEFNVKEAEKSILKLVKSGVGAGALFNGLFDAIDASDFEPTKKNKALAALGEYEFRVLSGCRLDIQARCFLRHLAVLR